MVYHASKYCNYTLKNVSDEIKDDKDFILSLIKVNPFVIKYISDRLKKDKTVILLAARKNIFTYKYSKVSLYNSRRFRAIQIAQEDFEKKLFHPDLFEISEKLYDYKFI